MTTRSPRRSIRRLLAGMTSVGLLVGMTVAALSAPAHAQDTSADGELLLVLDSSNSMRHSVGGGMTRIEAAQEALRTTVNALPSEARVGLRVFGATKSQRDGREASCTDSQLAVPIGTTNNADLHAAIDSYEPHGQTPISYALTEAYTDFTGQGKRSIVLVSDGEANCPPDPCGVAQQLADADPDLEIHTIGFQVEDRAKRELQCIADAGRGTYYAADNASELANSLWQAGADRTGFDKGAPPPADGDGQKDNAPTDVDATSEPTAEPADGSDQSAGDDSGSDNTDNDSTDNNGSNANSSNSSIDGTGNGQDANGATADTGDTAADDQNGATTTTSQDLGTVSLTAGIGALALLAMAAAIIAIRQPKRRDAEPTWY